MFDHKGRVTKTADGACFWYDQDVIFLDYDYHNDCVIDLDVEYKTPGFGILLSEIDTDNPFDASYSVLYRLGDQTYSVEESILKQQSHNTSGIFYTDDDAFTLHLTFYKTENKIWMTRTYTDAAGIKQTYGDVWTTGATLSEALPDYHIGFYSNAGNKIRKISIATGMPKDWVVNIRNTNGGRVSFHTDGFTIEECEFDADIEQQNIELAKGTYWLDYLKSEGSDIMAYVNPALTDKETEGHLTNEPTILDKTKSILQPDGSFTLDKPAKVNLKFSGTHGTIDNIAIKDLKDSSYISTDDTGNNTREGSCVIVDLTKIKAVEWTGIIRQIPDDKLTEKPTYSVWNGDTEGNRTIQDAGITLGKQYDYVYAEKTGVTVQQKTHALPADSSKLYIFHNVNAVITRFVVTYKDGKQLDVLNSLTYKIYISDTIESPIIVTDTAYNPYDLSAAYREVVIPRTRLELFSRQQPANLSQRVDKLKSGVTVYGIPKTARIDKTQRTIDRFASEYTELPPTQYTVDTKQNAVHPDDSVWTAYKYIVVQYTGADYFTYVFTNWEREWFDLNETEILQFEKPVAAETDGRFLVYGIPNGTAVHEDYIYRVSSGNMLNSIDLFANAYDTLSSELYTVNTAKRRIFIKDAVRAKYRYIVVDYLKTDSYAVNHLPDIGEYEVDCSTTNDTSYALYDMDKTGAVGRYQLPGIYPRKDTYITAAKKVNS